MNDNGYYWVRLKDEVFSNRDVIAIFKRNCDGGLKTSYVYRMYLSPFMDSEHDISFYGSICKDDEISEIRPCNENEKALLNRYYDKYREMNSVD